MTGTAPTATRTVVLVLGMHRTGTSLTTAVLNAIGVTLSEDLMPANEFNQNGYFESSSLVAIHDALLAELGSAWNVSELLHPFPANWWRSPGAAKYKEQLKALVSEELGKTSGMWGFKDPRAARLLPLWKEIVRELELDARYVVAVRDPREVAESLYKRERVAPLLSELLWLEHYAGIVTELGPDVHAIVDYDRWCTDPLAEANYLVSALGLPGAATALEDAIAPLVQPELRHHTGERREFVLPYSRDLYDALKRNDRPGMQMMVELFHITKAFTASIVRFTEHAASERAARTRKALDHGIGTVAELHRLLGAVRQDLSGGGL